MGVFGDVLRELAKMFFGEPRLSIPVLILVAVAAAVAHFVGPLACAGVLLIGCLGVLAENVLHTARKARSRGSS